jgi:hypothetical protein
MYFVSVDPEATPSATTVRVRAVRAVRVPWSSASFLVYLGGLTILGAVGSLLNAQRTSMGRRGSPAGRCSCSSP